MPENGVYGLSDKLLHEMANALAYGELGELPTEQALRGFIRHVGPAKLLQDNIDLVRARLRTHRDAVRIAADWTDRSGVLMPMDGSFLNPGQRASEETDVIITGGVCRWELRRMEELIRQIANGRPIGRVFLVAGSREMAASEHDLVAAYRVRHDDGPTESDVMEGVIAPWLKFIGLDVKVVAVPSGVGNEVMAHAALAADVVNRTVTVVSNAPAGIQNAAQLRAAARAIDPGYDRNGDQLFVLSAGINVARQGEGPEMHQNPFTALGQIARNALYIHLEQQSLIRNKGASS
jgi:hypothetical protein